MNLIKHFVAVALSVASVCAFSDTYYLNGNDGMGKSSFAKGASNGVGAKWTIDGGTTVVEYPEAGNEYIVKGHDLRTPDQNASYTFAGDKLTLETENISAASPTWGKLVNKHKGSKTLTITNFWFKNGFCAISDKSSNIGTVTIAGNIYIEGGYAGYFGTSGSETDSRYMSLLASLHGSGDAVFSFASANTAIGLKATNGNADFTGRLILDNDGVHNTTIGGGSLNINLPESWPANPATLVPGGVTVNYGGTLNFNADIASTGANRGMTINNKICNVKVTDGHVAVFDGPITSSYGFNKIDPGKLALAADNSGLASGSAINVQGGTLKLAGANSAGSAAVTLASGTTLEIDPSSGAVQFASLPSGLVNLKVSAASVSNPESIPLFSFPTGAAIDLDSINLATELPESVETDNMILVATDDSVSGRTTVSYILPAGDMPTVEVEMKSLAGTSVTYTLTLGYVDENVTDAMSVTAYYGATDGGTVASAWDSSLACGEKTPGVYDLTVPLAEGASYYVAFCVQHGTDDPVWTVAQRASTQPIALSAAPAQIVECDKWGVGVVVSRPAENVASALDVLLSYSGAMGSFEPESLTNKVTISAGNATATVRLRLADNSEADGNRTLVVSAVSSGDYVVDAGSSTTITVLDDEGLEPAVCMWTGGAGDLKWETPSNWQDGKIPTVLDTAKFTDAGLSAGAVVTVESDARTAKLLVETGLNFTIAGAALEVGGIERTAEDATTLTISAPLVMFAGSETNCVWNIAGAGSMNIEGEPSKIAGTYVMKVGAGNVNMRCQNTKFTGPWIIREGQITASAYDVTFRGTVTIGGGDSPAKLHQSRKNSIGSSTVVNVYTNGTYQSVDLDNGRAETIRVYDGGVAQIGSYYYMRNLTLRGGTFNGGTAYNGRGIVVEQSDRMSVMNAGWRFDGYDSYAVSVARGTAPVDVVISKSLAEGASDKTTSKTGGGIVKSTVNFDGLKNHFKINGGTWYVDNPDEYGLGIQETTVAAGAKLGGTGCVGMKDAKNATTLGLSNGSESSYATLSPGTIDETTGAHIYGTFASGRSSAHNNLTLGNWAHLEIGVGPKDPETKLSPADKLMVYGNLEIGSDCTLDLTTNSAALDEIKGGTFTIVEADKITGTFATITKPKNSWKVAYETGDDPEVVTKIVLNVPARGFAIFVQ